MTLQPDGVEAARKKAFDWWEEYIVINECDPQEDFDWYVAGAIAAHTEAALVEKEAEIAEREAVRVILAHERNAVSLEVYHLRKIVRRLENKRWLIGVVRGALKGDIETHGPITLANLISAEKRIVGMLIGQVIRGDGPAEKALTPEAERRPHDHAQL